MPNEVYDQSHYETMVEINGFYQFLNDFYPWVLPAFNSLGAGVTYQSGYLCITDHLGDCGTEKIDYNLLDNTSGKGALALVAVMEKLIKSKPNRVFHKIETPHG